MKSQKFIFVFIENSLMDLTRENVAKLDPKNIPLSFLQDQFPISLKNLLKTCVGT